MPWTDSHCHIPFEGLDESVIAEARDAGVTRLIDVGTDVEQSRAAIAVAHVHDGVWATVGLHPHDAKEGVAGLEPLLSEPRVVAVGECGLDYHYDHSPREAQRDVFRTQVGWARTRDLALVVHTREAWDDTFAILEEAGVPPRTVFHCFTGGPREAARAVELGAFVSFSGIVTFKRADEVRAAVTECPDDRLLVETDSPYLAPVPHRGRPNRPALVPLVGAALAAVRGVTVDRIEALTWANAARAFDLPGG